jgi:hypothetical protein
MEQNDKSVARKTTKAIQTHGDWTKHWNDQWFIEEIKKFLDANENENIIY